MFDGRFWIVPATGFCSTLYICEMDLLRGLFRQTSAESVELCWEFLLKVEPILNSSRRQPHCSVQQCVISKRHSGYSGQIWLA